MNTHTSLTISFIIENIYSINLYATSNDTFIYKFFSLFIEKKTIIEDLNDEIAQLVSNLVLYKEYLEDIRYFTKNNKNITNIWFTDDLIIRYLEDEKADVRQNAIHAIIELGWQNKESIIPALENAMTTNLKSEDDWHHRNTIETIIELGWQNKKNIRPILEDTLIKKLKGEDHIACERSSEMTQSWSSEMTILNF